MDSGSNLHNDLLDNELSKLEKEFNLSQDSLKTICDNFIREIKEGLCPDSKSSLAMIPSFVTSLPNGTEKGEAYALDIGGTNIRVIKFVLHGNGQTSISGEPVRLTIPKELQSGKGEDLFDFIADTVGKLIKPDQTDTIGFTFSFPIEQKAIGSGILVSWTKSFEVDGVVGKDVVELLSKSFERKKMKCKINAILDDSVGTLVSGCYQYSNDCYIGLIVGTGINTCYWEELKNIKKPIPNYDPNVTGMVINMESGNFGSRPDRIGKDLPLTEYDKAIDNASNSKGTYLLEKQVSGLYLGVILTEVIKKQSGNLFKGANVNNMRFYTSDLSDIDSDDTENLDKVQNILSKDNIGISSSTLKERMFVKQATSLIATRAAKLSATTIAGVLKHIGKDNTKVLVAVDGSVFEKYHNYQNIMKETLDKLLGHNKAQLKLSIDGSVVGAAITSFMVQ